jgi:hypothetical protein
VAIVRDGRRLGPREGVMERLAKVETMRGQHAASVDGRA